MQERDFQAELLSKMETEQEKFKGWLLSQPPDEILNHVYEFTAKEDILCEMRCWELTPKQAKALLKSPCPLEDVFKDYQKLDTDNGEQIRQTISSRADKIIKRENEKEAR